MALRKTSVAYHPVFGPMPPWCVSRCFRGLMLVTCGGMGLGLLWFALAALRFEVPASRLSESAQAVALLALFLGSLSSSVFFGGLALWQCRLRKPQQAADV